MLRLIFCVKGPPGAGKSTFIENFGLHVLDTDKSSKISVLCVDPSSSFSGGSILGDKTRMTDLSKHERAYLRPSPTGGDLGGVTCHTADTILVCQSAGYELTFIETVGLGQNEIEVDKVCDMVILVLPPGGGDDLQGVKKGIVEVADLIVVNKCDGDLVNTAKRTAADYQSALPFVRKKVDKWTPLVFLTSSKNCSGFNNIWKSVKDFHSIMQMSGELERKRFQQKKFLICKQAEKMIKEWIDHSDRFSDEELETILRNKSISSRSMASILLPSFFQ